MCGLDSCLVWSRAEAQGGRPVAADPLVSRSLYSLTWPFTALPGQLSWWLGAWDGHDPCGVPMVGGWGDVFRCGMVSEAWALVPAEQRRGGEEGASRPESGVGPVLPHKEGNEGSVLRDPGAVGPESEAAEEGGEVWTRVGI